MAPPPPAPDDPRRQRRQEELRARDSHVWVPPEGIGDVLYHPLHQHRHFFTRLGHVGGGSGGSRAPPGERRAARGSSAGSAPVCAGLAAPPTPPPRPPRNTSGSATLPLSAPGVWSLVGLRWLAWSRTSQLLEEMVLLVYLQLLQVAVVHILF